MMLIVQAYVIRQEVKWAIIRECLWDRDGRVPWTCHLTQRRAVEDVVFSDEVPSAGM